MSDEHTEESRKRDNPFSRRSEFKKFRKPTQKRGRRKTRDSWWRGC